MSELDDFLDHQRQLGSQDSSGVFTLNLARAQATLRRFALADPNFYLLKLVQAGVALEADRVELAIGQRSTRLGFLSSRAATPEALLKALENPQQVADPAVRHLAVGLNTAPLGRFEWTHSTRQSSLQLAVEGDQAELVAGPPRPEVPEHRHLYQLLLTRPRLDQARAVRAELDAVTSATAFSPVPVVVNGRPTWSSLTRPEALLCRYQAGSGLSLPNPSLAAYQEVEPGLFAWQGGRVGSSPTWLVAFEAPAEGERMPCQMVMRFARKWIGSTRLTIVVDGVTLPPKRVDIGLSGMEAFLSGHGLQLDLSEFQVVEDQAYADLLDRLWRMARQSLAPLCRHWRKIGVVRGRQAGPARPAEQVALHDHLRTSLGLHGLTLEP
ncbi:MAG: hypothetical protein AB7S38_35595 [Vulcanimicrobiota bacterium]